MIRKFCFLCDIINLKNPLTKKSEDTSEPIQDKHIESGI